MSTLNERIAACKKWRHVLVTQDGAVYEKFSMLPRKDWSGSIADAWDLVAQMGAAGHDIRIEYMPREVDENSVWFVQFSSAAALADTAPAAIAAAYLAAMEEQK
jgi:hypothetical protein